MSQQPKLSTTLNPRAFILSVIPGFQFSLRSLLLTVTVTCLLLGIVLYRAREQERSARAIEKAYGRILYDYHHDRTGEFKTSATSSLPGWMTQGIGLHIWHSIVFVDLDSEQVKDETLSQLRNLRSLEVLHISNTKVTNDGFVVLRSLPRLRFLTLNTTGIDDRVLDYLADCLAMEELELLDAEVTDAGLIRLKRNRRLQRLVLEGTQVTDEGVRELQKALPKCFIERG